MTITSTKPAQIAALTLAGLIGLATAAAAHVTLETPEAAQKSTYKAVLRVGHGCEGEATQRLRVRIPEGVIAVKPMPKPGWTIEIVKGAYKQGYDYYGTKLTEGVTELVWSGNELPDDYYDEFTFRAYLTEALPVGSMVWFPVVQECANGAERWIEIPAEGQDADDFEMPAAGVKIGEPGHGH